MAARRRAGGTRTRAVSRATRDRGAQRRDRRRRDLHRWPNRLHHTSSHGLRSRATSAAARTGGDRDRRAAQCHAGSRIRRRRDGLALSGARGIRHLREALGLVDGGAESPQETRLRLLLVQSGIPRPVTQIPVRDDRGRVVRRIDMGWPEWMVGAEYDGEQHFTDPDAYAADIERLEFLAGRGWTIVRVSSRQLRWQRPEVVVRVRRALAAAGMPARDYGC